MVHVIGLGMSRQRDQGAVMEIVVPECVHAVSAGFRRAHEPRVLRLVFIAEVKRSSRRGFAQRCG